jgi:predicted esterase
MLLGFHGYAESAEEQLARLQSIPGAERWLLVSIQGLNRFYRRRSDEVVAGWMTRQDRELAIADNVAYVSLVVNAVAHEWNTTERLAMAAFSQGVATAFRAAVALPRPCVVAALGGDIPPELDGRALSRLKAVLVGRGTADEWYTAEKCDRDVERLNAAAVPVQRVTLEAGHEWTPEFSAAAGAFLMQLG